MTAKRRRPRARSTIDDHEEREKIEFDLALGKSMRSVAKKYGLSKSAVARHAKRIPPHLRAANLAEMLKPGEDLDKLRHEESRGLIAILASQRARLHLVQDAAIAAEDHELTLKAAAAIHRNAELLGGYLGELVQHTKMTTVSVIVSPQFAKLRNIVVDVLRAYPEALSAFTDRMRAFEAEELGAITRAPPPTTSAITHQP
jgi:hypothetical protein